jgi:hypothetical protein
MFVITCHSNQSGVLQFHRAFSIDAIELIGTAVDECDKGVK